MVSLICYRHHPFHCPLVSLIPFPSSWSTPLLSGLRGRSELVLCISALDEPVLQGMLGVSLAWSGRDFWALLVVRARNYVHFFFLKITHLWVYSDASVYLRCRTWGFFFSSLILRHCLLKKPKVEVPKDINTMTHLIFPQSVYYRFMM